MTILARSTLATVMLHRLSFVGALRTGLHLCVQARAGILLLLVLCGAAQAQTIAATASPKHTVTISTVTPITVSVSGGPGNARDYVALFMLGAANYFDWFYLHNSKTRATKGSNAGTVTFMAPRAGLYEAKFYSLTDAGVATLLKSVPITVVLTPIELGGLADVTVMRQPDSNADEINLTIQAGKATLLASQSTIVKVDSKIVSSGP